MSRVSEPPYELTFEQNQQNGFYESVVAGQALGINAVIQDSVEICDEEALVWANLSRRIGHNPNPELPQTERVNTEELRSVGKALLFYGNRTRFDLSGMMAPSGIQAAVRRVEGDIALCMASLISKRIKIPEINILESQYSFTPWYSNK